MHVIQSERIRFLLAHQMSVFLVHIGCVVGERSIFPQTQGIVAKTVDGAGPRTTRVFPLRFGWQTPTLGF